MATRTLHVAAIAVVLAACSSTPVAPLGAPSTAPSASVAATTAEAAGETASATALGDGDGEAPSEAPPRLEELRAAAMACESDEEGEIDGGCQALERWIQEEAPFAGGIAIETLLAMLASDEPRARRLASEKLRVIDESTLDASALDAIFAAADKERLVPVVKSLAEVVAGLDLVKAGRVERAVALSKAHPVTDFAETFLLHAGWSNRHPALLGYAVEASRSPSSRLRNAALQTASKHTADYAPVACKMVNALRTDQDKFVANRARTLLAEGRGCGAFFDALLAELGAVDVAKEVDQSVGTALDSLCRHEGLGDKQRERAAKAARRITEAQRIHANTRYYTLSAVIRCDAKDGPAFVAKFKTDPDSIVARRAAELVP